MGVLTGLYTHSPPSLTGNGWTVHDYHVTYIGMRKEVPIHVEIRQLAIYSNATRASNIAVGGLDEAGVLGLAEVQVFSKFTCSDTSVYKVQT